MAERGRRANTEGSIYQRGKDGRWVGAIGIPGTSRRQYVYARTREEAAAKLNAAIAERERGISPADQRVTVEQYLEMWLEEVVKPTKRPNTYTGYEVNVRLHIVPSIGKVRIARLSTADVRRMLRELAAKKSTRGTLKPQTIRYCLAVLRKALSDAVADGYCHRNVAKLVQGPEQERQEDAAFTPEEVKDFLEKTKDDRLHALWVCGFTLGMRQSELLGLRWTDINWDGPTLRVEQQLYKARKAGASFSKPKSERSRRDLALPAPTVKALKAHRVRQIAERLQAGSDWQDTGLVFTTKRGTAIDQRNAGRFFKNHVERLKMRDQHFHEMRHACATYLLSQAVPLKVVQEILGHSQIQLTADTYAHVIPQLQEEAMRHMDRAFGDL